MEWILMNTYWATTHTPKPRIFVYKWKVSIPWSLFNIRNIIIRNLDRTQTVREGLVFTNGRWGCTVVSASLHPARGSWMGHHMKNLIHQENELPRMLTGHAESPPPVAKQSSISTTTCILKWYNPKTGSSLLVVQGLQIRLCVCVF